MLALAATACYDHVKSVRGVMDGGGTGQPDGRGAGFGPLLRQYRLQARLTQEELAERAGMSVRGISALEQGERQRPYPHTVRQLASALGLSTEEQAILEASVSRRRQLSPQPASQALAPGRPRPQGSFLGAHPVGPLIAREQEIGHLLALAERVAAGRGKTILVRGEPGVGKTRLVQEVMLALEERDFVVGTGRAFEQEQGTPFAPATEALSLVYVAAPDEFRQRALARWPYLAYILPDALRPPQAHDAQDQQRLFWAVHSFLAALAASQPVALLFDDLHWADRASLDLLLFLARHATGSRLLLLGTYRDLALYRQPVLEALIRELEHDQLAETVALHGLEEQETGMLVAALLGVSGVDAELAGLVQQRTEGNPFFVQQVLQALTERGELRQVGDRWERQAVADLVLPESVRAALQERLARLSQVTQELLQAASILGQQFAFEELEAMGDRAEEEVEAGLLEAKAAGLVRERDAECFLFTHVLIQHTLAADLPPRRRKHLHRAAAGALQSLAAEGHAEAPRRPAEIAQHFVQGGAPELALPYSLLAGQQAETVFAHAEAELHFRTAWQLAQDLDNRSGEAEALERLGGVLTVAGRWDEAVTTLEQAAEAYAREAMPEGLGRVASQLGRVHARRVTPDAGLDRLRAIADSLARQGPSAALAEVYLSLTHLYYITGQFDQKLAAASRAAQIGREVGDSQTVIRAGVLQADTLLILGELWEARRLLEELMPGLEVAGPSELLAFACGILARACTELGDLDQAIAHAHRAVDLAEQVGTRSETELAMLTLGHTLFVLGGWDQAEEWYNRAVDTGSSLEWSWGAAYRLLRLGELRLARGDWDAAAEHLQRCIEVAEKRRHLEILPALERALAERDLLEGHPEAALARLRRFATGNRAKEVAILPTLAWAYLECGDEAAAERTILHAIAQARARHLQLTLVEALHARARILIHQGQGEAAQRALEEAISLSRSVRYPYAEARCLYESGLVATQRGDAQGARGSLQQALSIFRRLGARPYLEQVQRALCGFG